jgi:hypothetical protein
MQISWGVWNSPIGGLNLQGCGAAQALCWCNDVGSVCDGTTATNLVRAARIRITSRGFSNPKDFDYQTGAFRPASFNHPAGAVDNITRAALQTSFSFFNFPILAVPQ